ncbi:suppressor APC domain-containing protein 1 isoform X1 [Carettochelys insculpta]|uniref:suppressor APC domain-containing protein 1 isoform X1 n=1 Tax=Carettochelys insculpta TaxID=44489 RepID=UPI003EBF1ACD
MSSLATPPAPGRPPRLPRPFIRSLRTLFDILEETGGGAVHLSDIESRWGRGGPGLGPPGDPLPPGVLPALRHVAGPSGGYLTFPRLVAGLRMALLRNPGPEPAETGHSSGQECASGEQPREGEPRGVTRSRSINSLSPAGHPRSPRVPEPRRHTITHGIDYEALQRRRTLERERDALLQGLHLAERMRTWYRRHLLAAQRRQEREGAEPDYLPESCPSHSCHLLAQVEEVNLGLQNLLASPGKTDPRPDFLADSPGPRLWPQGQTEERQRRAVTVLKEQNQLLIQEVAEKSDRIARLEREKAALRQQLRESHGPRLPRHKEATFL